MGVRRCGGRDGEGDKEKAGVKEFVRNLKQGRAAKGRGKSAEQRARLHVRAVQRTKVRETEARERIAGQVR